MTFPRTLRAPGRAAAPCLGLGLLLLGGCAMPDLDVGGGAWMPLSANRNAVTMDSLTIQRVRGGNPEVAALLPEPGNVWPAPEPERPTLLGGPEEAFRNIPEYRPAVPDDGRPRAPVAGMPAPLPRGSGTPPSALPPPPQPATPATAPAPRLPPPPPRTEGQVITDPAGRPAVTTGSAGNVRGFTQPGVGGGAVIRDGNVETWIGPDGQARSRVVPQ